MLEAIRERSQSWLAKLILALITIPFALWGVDSYLQQAGSSVTVAKIGSQRVTVQEYGNAMQEFRSQMQAAGKTDPALLEDPEVKQSVLDKLIVSRLLNMEVHSAGFSLGDEQLGKYILSMPEFQKDGKFSQELYDNLLSQNRLSPSQFEARLRNDLLIQQLKDGVAAGAFIPNGLVDGILHVERQQREVSVAELRANDFTSQAKIEPSQVKAYYDKNADKLRVPEQVKLEYVVFSANNLITSMQVTEDETRKYYEENATKFQGDEQRRASHILIGFGGKTDAAAKAAARENALKILAEVKKNPSKFEQLAQKYSQDTGSAEKGGDLGLFGHGSMVKPFEDAVFAMLPGAVSDLVESEFGYHIIKLTEIKGKSQDYQSAHGQIRADLMYQKALAKFAEKAEGFSNMVYEQSTSLQPVAQAFGVQVLSTIMMTKADVAKFMKSDKLVNAVFSDEVLKDKRNTEAVETSPNTLVAARVVEYKPSSARPFSEAAPAIEDYLKHEQAVNIAIRKGESMLAELRQGKEVAGLLWTPPEIVDRKNTQGLNVAVAAQVFKVDAVKVPAFGGITEKNKGYTLVKVSKVNVASQVEDTDKKAFKGELQAALAMEYMHAYVNALKAKEEISIDKQLMGAGQQQ